MYALTPKSPNEELVKYLNHPIVKSITHTGEYFKLDGQIKRGIHSSLRRIYYPHYQMKVKRNFRRSKLNRKGSSKAKGEAIDKALFNYVIKKKKTSLRNSCVKALVSYWDSIGHTIQAAQVPVFIRELDCCTQADIITQDAYKRLFVWEVKVFLFCFCFFDLFC